MLENNNVQAGLVNTNAKIDAKAEINTDIKGELKAADTIYTQIGGTYNDNRSLVNGITFSDMATYVDSRLNDKIGLLKVQLENKLLTEQISKLKNDMGVINSYKETIYISAIKDDIDFDKILSSTLIERIQSEDTDEQNTYTQAISVMKNFTKTHLKLISLFYIFRSGYFKEFNSAEQFIEFYQQYISQLIDIPLDKLRDIGTAIIGNGCAVTYTFGSSIIDLFDTKIAEYIAKLSTKEAITEEEKKQKDIIDELNKIWKNSGLTSAFPTAIGKCIGRIYLKEILNLQLNNVDNNVKVQNYSATVTYGDIENIYKPE